MTPPSYKPGLVSSEQLEETDVTGEELRRARDLLRGNEKPLTGFELHLMEALIGNARPITPKEQALVGLFQGEEKGRAIVESFQRRKIEQDAINEDYINDVENDLYADRAYQRQEQELNNELLAECWGYVESASRSEETGWSDEE